MAGCSCTSLGKDGVEGCLRFTMDLSNTSNTFMLFYASLILLSARKLYGWTSRSTFLYFAMTQASHMGH